MHAVNDSSVTVFRPGLGITRFAKTARRRSRLRRGRGSVLSCKTTRGRRGKSRRQRPPPVRRATSAAASSARPASTSATATAHPGAPSPRVIARPIRLRRRRSPTRSFLRVSARVEILPVWDHSNEAIRRRAEASPFGPMERVSHRRCVRHEHADGCVLRNRRRGRRGCGCAARARLGRRLLITRSTIVPVCGSPKR
jgi:hypothetical protein